jgi:integrase
MPRKTFTFEGRRYQVTAPTESELIVKVALRKRDLEEGRKRIEKIMTVKAWSEIFVKTYLDGTMAESTLGDHQYRLDNFILPALGSLRMCDVRQVHCQGAIKELSGFSRDRINKAHNTMYRLFETGKANGLVLENPAKGITLPEGEEDGTHRSITDAEREITLLVAKSHRCGLWIRTTLYTGIRPQEAAALQGRHINIKTAELRIEKARKKTGKIGDPKTKAGTRIIPIPEILLADFKALRPDPFEYVFKNASGGRMSASNMSRGWANFKREMQIAAGCRVYRSELIPPLPIADDLVPYCYRHTYCTDLQAAGVPLNVAKYLMGHSDIRMTANIYTHTTTEMLQAAKAAIDAYAFGAGISLSTPTQTPTRG